MLNIVQANEMLTVLAVLQEGLNLPLFHLQKCERAEGNTYYLEFAYASEMYTIYNYKDFEAFIVKLLRLKVS